MYVGVVHGGCGEKPAVRPLLRGPKKKYQADDATESERRWIERERTRRQHARDRILQRLNALETAKWRARHGKPSDDSDEELYDDWCPHYPKAALLLYELMDATEWAHLPNGGGWLDQDEALMEDVAQIARKAQFVRAHVEVNEADGE